MYSVVELKKMTGVTGQVGLVAICPDLARKLLVNNMNNRKLSQNIVNKYSKQMREEKWNKSPDALAFDNEGFLTNGQHRLNAIIASNTTQKFFIAFNVENYSEMDRGKARNLTDNIVTDKSFSDEIRSNSTIQKAVQTLLRIAHKNKTTTDEIKEFIKKYENELLYLYEQEVLNGSKLLNTMCISAAFIAAYIQGADIENLKHIRKVLNTGLIESSKDNPIIGLRDKLMSIKGGGATVESLKYQYTLYCIEACEKGRVTKVCKSSTNTYYSNFK